eukprot:2912_1
MWTLSVAVCIYHLFSILTPNVYGAGKVGINLENKNYYSPGIAWKNRLYQSMAWISGDANNWHNNMTLDLDSNGYVKSLKKDQIARSIFLGNLEDPNDKNIIHYQTPGEHIFLFEGDLNPQDIEIQVTKVIDTSQKGRWILNITGMGILNIKNISNPSNYPRNFVIVPAQWESSYKNDIWDPYWIKPLNETAFSNLRFMDFLETNGSPNREWNTRTLPSNYTQGQEYGVSWELIIDLCNRMSPIDCWINVPHLATDSYVQSLAEMWYVNYTGKGVIHIEYSNECWNGMFQCYHYMVNQSEQEGISVWQWYGKRVCQIRQIFDGVYGSKSSSALYSVLGTQEVNSWITNQELLNDNNKCVDGIAIAQYYCTYGLNDTQKLQMTQDQLFDNIESQTTQQHYTAFMLKQEIVANNYTGVNGNKLEVIGYEGSWGCTPDTYAQPMRDNLTTLYNNMCHNSRITQTVVDNLENFHNITGGTLFNMYDYIGFAGQYGNWGHLEFQDSYNNDVGNGGYKFMGIQKYLGV